MAKKYCIHVNYHISPNCLSALNRSFPFVITALKLSAGVKNKSPDAVHQGFVVDYPDEISNYLIVSDLMKVVRFVEEMNRLDTFI